MFLAFWVHDFANEVAVLKCTSDTDVHARAILALRLNGLRDNARLNRGITTIAFVLTSVSRQLSIYIR